MDDPLKAVMKLGSPIAPLAKKMRRGGHSDLAIARQVGSLLMGGAVRPSPSPKVITRYVLARLAEAKGGVRLGSAPDMDNRKFARHKMFWNDYVKTHKNAHGIPVDVDVFRVAPLRPSSRVRAANLKALPTLGMDDQIRLLYQFVSQPRGSVIAQYPGAAQRRHLVSALGRDANEYHRTLRHVGKFNPHVRDAFPKAKILLDAFSQTRSNTDALVLSSLIEDLRAARPANAARVRDKMQRVLLQLKDRAPPDSAHRTSS
jgi:hypothetical protein